MRSEYVKFGCLALLGIALLVAALPEAHAWPGRGPFVAVDTSWSDDENKVSSARLQEFLQTWEYPRGVRIVRIHDVEPLYRSGPFAPVVVQSWLGGRIDVYAGDMSAYDVVYALSGELAEFDESPSYFSAGYRR